MAHYHSANENTHDAIHFIGTNTIDWLERLCMLRIIILIARIPFELIEIAVVVQFAFCSQ